jgi:hypothetical protein
MCLACGGALRGEEFRVPNGAAPAGKSGAAAGHGAVIMAL